ncbi:MAG: MaoC/PaaZ C-terminal domain-containing protein [Acidimicrobiales bacterium]|nr:MaoC/PaaZ C-terminal domain-containing protein [Acidimicrobiales bacterium]
MTAGMLGKWSVRAQNLPEHASNPIHTDEGGRAAGFDAAVVAGVTVYAYLTRPVVEAWGVEWLSRGTAEIRFTSPVMDNDPVDCVPEEFDGGAKVWAMVFGKSRARLIATPSPDDRAFATGPLHELFEQQVEPLVGEWENYGLRAGDDLGLYAETGIVHPAVWPSLANSVVKRNLVEGPWIHTRSRIRHHSTAQVGAAAVVDAVLVDRFETRSGLRAVLDVRISVDGVLVASLEHEALVSLHP